MWVKKVVYQINLCCHCPIQPIFNPWFFLNSPRPGHPFDQNHTFPPQPSKSSSISPILPTGLLPFTSTTIHLFNHWQPTKQLFFLFLHISKQHAFISTSFPVFHIKAALHLLCHVFLKLLFAVEMLWRRQLQRLGFKHILQLHVPESRGMRCSVFLLQATCQR